MGQATSTSSTALPSGRSSWQAAPSPRSPTTRARPSRFVGPSGIASDGAGYLYVASTTTPNGTTDSTIRKISVATGTVTTLADRTGGSIHFDALYDIVSDGAGSLYVADGAVIEKVVIATGAVSTLAGTPGLSGSDDGIGAAARLSGYSGMASDGAATSTLPKATSTPCGESSSRPARSPRSRACRASTAARTGQAPPPASATPEASPATERAISTSQTPTTTPSGRSSWRPAPSPRSPARRGTRATSTAPEPPPASASVPARPPTGRATSTSPTGPPPSERSSSRPGPSPRSRARGQPGAADGTGAAAGFSSPPASPPTGRATLYVADGSTIRTIAIATGTVTMRAAHERPSGSLDGTGRDARFQLRNGDRQRRGRQPLRRRHRQPRHPEGRRRHRRRHHRWPAGGGWGQQDGTGRTRRFNGPQRHRRRRGRQPLRRRHRQQHHPEGRRRDRRRHHPRGRGGRVRQRRRDGRGRSLQRPVRHRRRRGRQPLRRGIGNIVRKIAARHGARLDRDRDPRPRPGSRSARSRRRSTPRWARRPADGRAGHRRPVRERGADRAPVNGNPSLERPCCVTAV